jgi:hypothetical protein
VDVLVPEIARRDHATTEQLSALLDNRAEPAELPFLTGHLFDCDDCSRELNGLRAVRELLRGMPIRFPPRSFTLPLRQPVQRRFRHLIPIARALSAIAAVFCVLLFSADAMGATFNSAPTSKLTAAIQPDLAPRSSEANQSAARAAAPTGAPRPAAIAKPPPPAPASAPQQPSAAFAPRSSDSTAPSATAQDVRRAEGPLNSASGAGAGAAAAAQPAPEPTVTSMAAITPSALQAGQSNGRAGAPEQDTSAFGLSPLREASIVLGLVAVALFIASVLLRRVEMAPVEGSRDGLNGWDRQPPRG